MSEQAKYSPLQSLARKAKQRRMDMQCDPQWVLDLFEERDALRTENAQLLASLSAIRDIVTTEHESKASFIARVRALLPPTGPGNAAGGES